jgi:hypothetical protein
MQVKLFTGDETNTYKAVAFDAQSRETDVEVKADSLESAKSRISDSMADYRWVDVQNVSRSRSQAA